MLIAALIPDSSRARLIDAAKDLSGTVLATRDWKHLEQILTESPVSVMVIDPLYDKAIALHDLLRMLRRWPETPVVAYSYLTPVSAQALLLLSRQGLRHVVLKPYEDGRVRFGYVLQKAVAYGLVAKLRSALADRLAKLPIDILVAIEALFERPYLFQSGEDLVRKSGLCRTTVYRHMHQAKLGSPKRLFVATRVIHAVTDLRNHGQRIQDVAAKLRYGREETLAQHTALVLQVSPGQLRPAKALDGMTNDEVVTRVLTWLESS